MSKLKRPLTKNFYFSLTGKEPILNNYNLYNNFPMGLMILSKVDPTSCRDKDYFNENEKEEIEIKIKYINQQASDLFEIKENDNVSKIHEQLKQFKKFEKLNTTEETLDSILFDRDREEEFYGSFKSQASLIYVKYKINNEDYYICTDYYTDEKKIIQNQLFQSLKFQYIATLFHELYNPINALLFIIDENQNEDENKEEFKSNLGNQNNYSELDGSHFSIITENDYDKSNMQENENSSIKKTRKIDELYKNKLTTLHEKEKDISLLVNMIYIFLQNLILYLRINLGVNFNEKNENQTKEENLESNKNNDNNENKNNNFEEQKINEDENDKEDNSQDNNIYTDKYLTHVNRNKKLNLELSFYKHLNKFSYLFKFKNIHYCNDFSYLSDKYILTDESVFLDFIGQIYSFLYYVVPKYQGFDISYSLINDNKLKILFQKTNFSNKGGYRFNKIRKNNSCLLGDDKFKATSTVKTPEMTQEILYKLSEILGIKLKIMEYEDKKEDKYLTIIMPYVLDEDNDLLDSDINELPEDNFGKIPYLEEVVGRNILYENNEKSETDEVKLNENNNNIKQNNENNVKSNSILKNKNASNSNNINKTKINPQNSLNLNFYKISPERKASFLVEEVEEKNSSEEDFSSNKEDKKEIEIPKDNLNANNNNANNNNSNNNNHYNHNNNNNNNNNNISHSSISKSSLFNGGVSIKSNSQKFSMYKSKSPMSDKNFSSVQINNFKDLSSNYLNEIQNDNNNSKDILCKDAPNIRFNTNIKIKRNALTLIHQKYSNIEKLKSRGVEILSENDSENKKENDNKSLSEESVNSINDNNNLKDKKSITVEIDSDNFIEIENEDDDIDYDNNQKYINQNNNNKNNSVLLNVNYMNNSGICNNSPKNDKLSQDLLKNKKVHVSNKPSNKTLNYNKSANDNLFVIPEINENKKNKEVTSLKLRKNPNNNNNNKKESSSNICNCGCKDILLVDDDEFISKTFKNIIKKFKLEADWAENGQECLNMIKAKQEKNCQCSKNKYKIIFMDITMPVMDGIEAAKNIQKLIDENKLYDTLKIIFISAHVNLDLRTILSGIKCAIDYHAKPISADKYKSLLDKYYYPK